MKVVLASNNPGKVGEFQELLKNLPIDLLPQSELGIDEAEETGLSFVENAIIKARHAAQAAGLPAIADDSGLAVDALNGAPGIYSARYAGKNAAAQDNIHKLLLDLENVPEEKRTASFHCVLVFMAHALDPTPLICQGKWSGMILRAPQGGNGFGYDPVFYVPAEKKSAAELPNQVKNKISHRGIALQSLLKMLPDKL
ncbi:dITP/XTP pyrophosphatase [Aquicella siphonis]|uniref:dITP/XTP pyrophosphatase n=1 Tax=Aquicella siphonis TaxID=254247 RepID=A0A5E4PEA6_9COXI|nr:RdgB/HAM1 family non-canonical purine NTP pyrophosphatase [Aquicella siphonis]VVC74753.1 dITP/XTP pyrophosphatase [Aquicella siphonis]